VRGVEDVLNGAINRYLVDHEQQMMCAIAGALAIPSVLDLSTVAPDAPFGRPIEDTLRYVLSVANWLGFPSENVDHLVGRARFGGSGKEYAVLSHLDVVPAGTGWTVPPFAATLREGRLYGRGSIDDKGPAIASIFALAAARSALETAGIEPSHAILLLFGTDEESDWRDMEYYRAHHGLPSSGFSPDGDFPIVNGEKGILGLRLASMKGAGSMLKAAKGGTRVNVVPQHAEAVIAATPDRLMTLLDVAATSRRDDGFIVNARGSGDEVTVSVDGSSAHASTPAKGKNAITRLLGILDSAGVLQGLPMLQFIARSVGMDWTGRDLGVNLSDQISGGLTLNVGVLDWNDGAGSIDIDIRYPLTSSKSSVMGILGPLLTTTASAVTILDDTPPHFVAPSSSLIATLGRAYREHTYAEPRCVSIGGGTYARLIPDAVAFGPAFPGHPTTEHGPDEYIELDDLLVATRIYASAMLALLTGQADTLGGRTVV
jgi:succinyl-diaminopimelate desuccinylase